MAFDYDKRYEHPLGRAGHFHWTMTKDQITEAAEAYDRLAAAGFEKEIKLLIDLAFDARSGHQADEDAGEDL